MVHFNPKSVGETKIQAAFSFGGRNFKLQGIATTKARFQQSTSSLTFESTEVDFVLTKQTPTEVDRFIMHGGDLQLKNFQDTPETVSATLLRCDEAPSEVILVPACGEKTFKPMRFELRYQGEVQVLPRRLIANRETLRFYLRGDVKSLDGAKSMMIDKQQVDCKASLSGGVLWVEFKNIFEPGEHRRTVRIQEITFPLLVSAR